MAGPTANVLSPDPLDSTRIAQIHEVLNGLGIDERPFLVSFGEEYEGELQELADSGLPEVLRWTPRDCVGLAAMCNDTVDHELLCRLCIAVARKIGGVVDLGGTIPSWPDPPLEDPRTAMKLVNPNELRGALFVASYPVGEGEYCSSHYADASLLESWLKSADFRMIK